MEPQTFFLTAFPFLTLFASAFSKVPVTVYYESLCPDSRDFVRNVLYQQYDAIASKIDLTLVPFGKARGMPNGQFQCQHGPRECRGNMLQACALNQLSPGKDQVNYVNCAMSSPGYGDQSCVTDAGLTWQSVEACMKGPLGKELMIKNEMETIANTPAPFGRDRGPTFVPTIVLNNHYSDEDQDTAFSNLELAICKYTAC